MISDPVSVAALEALVDILDTYSDHSLEFVRSIFGRSHLGFDETVNLAIDAGLVELRDGGLEICLSSDTEQAKVGKTQASAKERQVQEYLLLQFFDATTVLGGQMESLVKRFQFMNGGYLWKPGIADIPQFAAIRNLLLEIGAIESEPFTGSYSAAPAFLDQLLAMDKKRSLSPGELEILVRSKTEVGTKAELAVMEYERMALQAFADLTPNIQHVAAHNVSAGYDIRSFERPIDDNSPRIERFIEVKAVSLVDWGFHWSRNECEAARVLGLQYYLYLVPVVSKGIPSVRDMRILRDPYQNVFNNDQVWSKCCESFSFHVKNELSQEKNAGPGLGL